MKKILLSLVINLAIVISIGAPISVFSAPDYGLKTAADKIGYDTSNNGTLMPKLNWYIGIVMGIVSIIFFSMVLYAGVRWLTARGKDDLAEKAKNALEAAVTGLVITMLAWGITSFVIIQLSKK